MAKYEKYVEYKDSGVEWLGDVPNHWGVEYSKWLFEERNIKATAQDEMLTASQKYGVIPQKMFMELEQQKVVQVLSGHDILKKAEANDFVISMRSFQGGIEFSEYSGAVSSAYVPLKPREGLSLSYYKHLFKSAQYIQALQTTTNLVRDGQALRYGNFIQVRIPLVPLEEAEKIGQFLDHETVKIDSLIAKQEKLIELLKEKRQAVISHAVTKGLNPDVAMKDSGVEWLGQVPEHWKMSRFKYIASIYGRIGFRGYTVDDIVDEGEGALVLSPSNIVGDKFSLEKRTYLSWKKYYESPEIMVNENDILLVKTGSTFGKSTIILNKDEPMTINPQMALIKKTLIDPRFLTYLFNSNFIKSFIDVSNTGSGMPTMTQENINNFVTPIPRIGEDTLIADFLDTEVRQIELIIKKAESAIQLMQERRTALISSAVTGKIDVRHWQNPNKNNEANTELGA